MRNNTQPEVLKPNPNEKQLIFKALCRVSSFFFGGFSQVEPGVKLPKYGETVVSHHGNFQCIANYVPVFGSQVPRCPPKQIQVAP